MRSPGPLTSVRTVTITDDRGRTVPLLDRNTPGSQIPDDAKLAIAQNGGGICGIEEAITCVTILGR